jgi:Aspartyl protease
MRQGFPALVLAFLAILAPARSAGPSKTCAVMSYQSDDRLIHVPARVNRVPLWFDIDSGARHSVIDLTTARRLHLTFVRADRMAGAGHGTALMLHAAPLTISVGSARLRVNDPWVMDLSHVGTSRHIDGLIGEDFFKAYVVRVDPVTRTVSFCDSKSFTGTSGGTTLPLVASNDRLFVRMTLTLPSGVSATHLVRVDTGSDDAVSDDLVRQSSIRRKSLQGVGIGKAYVDYSGVFATVQIGPYRIHNVWGPSGNPPAVGMEILRRFILTFDVPRGLLTLEPTAQVDDPVPSPRTE